MINIKILDNIEDIKKLELLRFKVFDMNLTLEESHIINTYQKNKIIPYALYIDNNLVAGCYVSNYLNTLHINYIFVDKMYQETGLKLGRLLLKKIYSDKEYLNKIFNTNFNISTIEANNPKAEAIYRKIGYHGNTILKKII